jgi:cytochrome c-type biogenesis protein CcmH/NrfG
MDWLEPEPNSTVPAMAKIILLRKAIALRPNDPVLHAQLGDAFLQCGHLDDAAAAYESAVRQDPRGFQRWAALARCYLELSLPDAALDACSRGEAHGLSADIHYQRGCALLKLNRLDLAHSAF